MMTKQQTKALEIAAGHLNVGNPDAFLQSVSRLIRAATNQKQIDAIKVAAFDYQFAPQKNDINAILQRAVNECATDDNAKAYNETTEKFVFCVETIELSNWFKHVPIEKFNMIDCPERVERFVEKLETRFEKMLGVS
jgi:hypothetical protein